MILKIRDFKKLVVSKKFVILKISDFKKFVILKISDFKKLVVSKNSKTRDFQ